MYGVKQIDMRPEPLLEFTRKELENYETLVEYWKTQSFGIQGKSTLIKAPLLWFNYSIDSRGEYCREAMRSLGLYSDGQMVKDFCLIHREDDKEPNDSILVFSEHEISHVIIWKYQVRKLLRGTVEKSKILKIIYNPYQLRQ